MADELSRNGDGDLSPLEKLDKTLVGWKNTRWFRIALQCMAGAIAGAGSGILMATIGGFAGAVSGMVGASSEAEQDVSNALMAECIRLNHDEIRQIKSDVMRILLRLDLKNEAVLNRIESPEYQSILRKAFHTWSATDGDERREYIRRLLTHAADPALNIDDLLRIFIEWIQRYTTLHFRVVRELYKEAGLTRAEIWERMGGRRTRDDSEEADVFKCLISDLSIGHVIHQARDVDPATGRRIKGRKGTSSGSALAVSAWDDDKQYVLTSVGRRFAHLMMTELVPKLGSHDPMADVAQSHATI